MELFLILVNVLNRYKVLFKCHFLELTIYFSSLLEKSHPHSKKTAAEVAFQPKHTNAELNQDIDQFVN